MRVPVNVFWCQNNTSRHHLLAQCVTPAGTGDIVKKATTYIGIADLQRVFVF
jgi:hypothetical protein